MKSVLTSLLVLISALAPLVGQEVATTAKPPALIKEGIRLHDEGRYDEAITRFEQALESEPENEVALYELGNTYFVAGRYDRCVEVGRRALKKPGRVEVQLYTMLGSCLSSAGNSRQALRVFEDGLGKFPDDPKLNFNVAITLSNSGRPKNAIEHLQKVVEVRPSYASPYFHLGDIVAREGRGGEAMIWLMRFLTLEPYTDRSVKASKFLFSSLMGGVTEETGGNVEILVDLGADKSESTLEVFRTLAAASTHLEDAIGTSVAERQVGALVSFVEMLGESSQVGGDNPLAGVLSQAAAAPFQLEKKGLLECFAYIAASKAGLAGADGWLEKNALKRQELAAALAELEP